MRHSGQRHSGSRPLRALAHTFASSLVLSLALTAGVADASAGAPPAGGSTTTPDGTCFNDGTGIGILCPPPPTGSGKTNPANGGNLMQDSSDTARTAAETSSEGSSFELMMRWMGWE